MPRVREYRTYVALGDSIISDDYPGAGAGTASLLYRNLDSVFPEFVGQDLERACPGIEFVPRCRTGYTSADVLQNLLDLKVRYGPTVVVVTVGGNDLLEWFSQGIPVVHGWSRFLANFDRIVSQIRRRCPEPDIFVGNIYDPTDGTGRVQSSQRQRGSQDMTALIGCLADCNLRLGHAIRHCGAIEVDLYSHFQGHGMRYNDPSFAHYCPDDSSGWFMMDIEPNARGASEARRRFWETLQEAAHGQHS